ncbi:acyl-CoA dehydrogenase [Streptomyces sp. NPDC050145]|uniref:acyl-CoA dehydrogenase n=1 Tax=Streptomyces sp. NPDC050145 TaxID=3365602 RepID=UPI00378AD2BA
MPIPLEPDGLELQSVARGFLAARGARAEGRALLDSESPNSLPSFWADLAALGWLGVHLPEKCGGGGAGITELVALIEESGSAVAPGPHLPTVLTSAVIARRGSEALQAQRLPGLADGSVRAACGLGGTLRRAGRAVTGYAGAVLGAGEAELLLLCCGSDLVLVEAKAPGVRIEIPANIDRGRRAARVWLEGVPLVEDGLLNDAVPTALALQRTLLSADAVGGARQCLEDAVAYAKTREQFGRAIGTFQAIKHHCTDMLVEAELAAAAVWDAARAADSDAADPRQFELAAAVAATLAAPAYSHNARLNIQVHGGIGFTWEHDAHLLLRRATAIEALLSPADAAVDTVRLAEAGVCREQKLALPPEVEARRAEVRAVAREIAMLQGGQRVKALVERGYAMPHWPRPWGQGASAGLQLLIDQEFAEAGLAAPVYGITGWVLATVLQHGTEEQVRCWLPPGLMQESTWCQLFSEPDAGSDAAAVTTRAVRATDGRDGWIVNGQKVWTSGAHRATSGLATVRTDPSASKHAGLTMMAIDMHAPGVEVRPLKQITGDARFNQGFNEVFLSDVFVPDEDVVGPVGGGWMVARSTLGNERLSIGGGQVGVMPIEAEMLASYKSVGRPVHLTPRLGTLLARSQAADLLNLRRAERAVTGAEPGPEGNVTKFLRAERHQEAAEIQLALLGEELMLAEEGTEGALQAERLLDCRCRSIAGGTSEITRNQIAERILGLPRDPLLR